jgi:hypothetical protein
MPAHRVLLPLLPLLAGCSTLMTPGPFHVPVDSEPRAATVVYQGVIVGRTPCVVAMQRSEPSFELRHPACHPRRVVVGTARNPWLAVNLVTCGLGAFVDIALGTDVALVDDPVKVHLAGVDGPAHGAWMRVLPTGEPLPPREFSPLDALLSVLAIAGQLVYDHNL